VKLPKREDYYVGVLRRTLAHCKVAIVRHLKLRVAKEGIVSAVVGEVAVVPCRLPTSVVILVEILGLKTRVLSWRSLS
jgi:hypothetical protein